MYIHSEFKDNSRCNNLVDVHVANLPNVSGSLHHITSQYEDGERCHEDIHVFDCTCSSAAEYLQSPHRSHSVRLRCQGSKYLVPFDFTRCWLASHLLLRWSVMTSHWLSSLKARSDESTVGLRLPWCMSQVPTNFRQSAASSTDFCLNFCVSTCVNFHLSLRGPVGRWSFKYHACSSGPPSSLGYHLPSEH